jgi:tRNA threonylcarbamoyl adenosine modification protein (Sua5/YciO/YrdC/YwlC family)
MAAPILEVNADHPQPRHVQRAVEILSRGGLIAYPTDTYYGLGCDSGSKKAVEKLYQLKGMDKRKQLTLLCPDLGDVAKYARVSNFAYRTLKGLTPGAFTFVLEATKLVPEILMSKQKQVGIRVPDSVLARELAAGLGRPLVTTSAADPQSGEVLVDPKDIKEVLGHGLDLILDGGLRLLEPSTVVSLVGDQIEVLRQGKGKLD